MSRHSRSPAHQRRHPRRKLGCGLVTIVLAIGLAWGLVGLLDLVTAPALQPTESSPPTPTLSSAGFNPGGIISDQEFTDTTTMSVTDIQNFLDTWGSGCEAGEYPCLAHYRESIPTRDPSRSCPNRRDGGENLSAATIIWRSAQACGINPQVILTTLQKEQGLITASGAQLTATRYDWAMGYGCPDGSQCDRQYAGFDTQVYQAAAQWRRYMSSPGSFNIQPGQVNTIKYSPDLNCGSTDIYIENAATAALYNYTPYAATPDAIDGYFADCNGAGIGNLRFYQYFTAWFGQ